MHGHFDYCDQLVSFLAMFIRKAAAQRLGADGPPDAAVPLKPIDPKAGWRIGSEFVIGYGMDAAERYRNLPFVGVIEES